LTKATGSAAALLRRTWHALKLQHELQRNYRIIDVTATGGFGQAIGGIFCSPLAKRSRLLIHQPKGTFSDLRHSSGSRLPKIMATGPGLSRPGFYASRDDCLPPDPPWACHPGSDRPHGRCGGVIGPKIFGRTAAFCKGYVCDPVVLRRFWPELMANAANILSDELGQDLKLRFDLVI
jgi:hypothetical protein